MIYYRSGKYHISNLKVHYIDEDEGEVIKFVGQEGKQWWIDFSDEWKDTFELKGFEEVEVTKEQIARLENVNALNLEEGVSYIDDYVINNDLSKVELGHPLYVLKQEQDLVKSQQMIVELQKQILLGGM